MVASRCRAAARDSPGRAVTVTSSRATSAPSCERARSTQVAEPPAGEPEHVGSTREKLRAMLGEHKLDHRIVELETSQTSLPVVEIFSASGMEEMDINLRDMFGNLFPRKKKRRKVKVPEALELLTHEEAQKLIDMDKVTKLAVKRVEQSGIIFLDELDKVAGREGAHGPDKISLTSFIAIAKQADLVGWGRSSCHDSQSPLPCPFWVSTRRSV